jgi:hypothetical protein
MFLAIAVAKGFNFKITRDGWKKTQDCPKQSKSGLYGGTTQDSNVETSMSTWIHYNPAHKYELLKDYTTWS